MQNNTGYSAITFALFFLGEYASMLLVSGICAILFLGGWGGGGLEVPIFAAKVALFAYLIVLVRAILPRYRYDKLLGLGWYCFLPLTLGFFVLELGLLTFLGGLPVSAEVSVILG